MRLAPRFGEGMKVGALALLREGRQVDMYTAQEHWRWARALDPAFGVSSRLPSLHHDNCAKHTGLVQFTQDKRIHKTNISCLFIKHVNRTLCGASWVDALTPAPPYM